MRKHAGFSVVLAFAVVVFTGSCAHMTVPKTGAVADMHCPGGQGHPHTSGPVICIDAETLNASPDQQHVHQGAWVHFYLTDASQELDIVFKDPAKVQYKGKNANEVWLRVKDDAAVGPAKYTAKNMSTGKSRDPEIVIEP